MRFQVICHVHLVSKVSLVVALKNSEAAVATA